MKKIIVGTIVLITSIVVHGSDSTNCDQAYKSKAWDIAFELCLSEAKSGNSRAKVNLGLLYRYGNGTKKDTIQAFKIFEGLASSDNPDAMINLANLYHHGEGGIKKDLDKAYSLYMRADRYEHPIAKVNIGLLHLENGYKRYSPNIAYAFISMAREDGYKNELTDRISGEIEKQMTENDKDFVAKYKAHHRNKGKK